MTEIINIESTETIGNLSERSSSSKNLGISLKFRVA